MAVPGAAHIPWQDPWRWGWWVSASVPWTGALALVGFTVSGSAAVLWLLPVAMNALLPLLDALLGEDRRNPPAAALPELESRRGYRWLVAAYVPGQWVVTVLGAAIAGTAELTLAGWAGLVLTVGGVNGIGINAAHELGHKRTRWEPWLARLSLVPVAYGHFMVEHHRGHHARVATPGDPASARLGESFWAFLPRTVLGGMRSAWALEVLRLRHHGKPVLHPDNENLRALAGTAVLFGGLTAAFGPMALLFLLLQAGYGISLLEVVNYIEHYGLLRPNGPDGRPVRCTPQHSWNSSHRASNLVLFNLQRHSDHHAHPARRYQALQHCDESPQLPSGYPGMLLLAYVPPLWRRVMDPRVLAHYGGNIGRAHRAAPPQAPAGPGARSPRSAGKP
jgi:alkane 1-monooxygenase